MSVFERQTDREKRWPKGEKQNKERHIKGVYLKNRQTHRQMYRQTDGRTDGQRRKRAKATGHVKRERTDSGKAFWNK